MRKFLYRFFSIFSLLLFLVSMTFPLNVRGQTPALDEYSRGNPEKYEYAEQCRECHELEFDVWQKTPHATGFKEMHLKESAKKIAKKLGFRLMKRNSLCIACHFTPNIRGKTLRAVSGVSCESCHGPAKDWINLHNDYGGKKVDHKTETPEHRASRIAKSREAGMRRPSDLYPVIENCFQCHLVPNERLVNVGGHGTGSGDFEFVAWSQKEMRHNFLDAGRSGKKENALRSKERVRLMYVVGRAVELEYILRGLAIATEEGMYTKSLKKRVRTALAQISDIGSEVTIPELDRMQKMVRSAKLASNNQSALLGVADAVSKETKFFLKKYDGSKLSKLDSLIYETEESEDEEEVLESEETFEAEEAFETEESDDTQLASIPPVLEKTEPIPPSRPKISEKKTKQPELEKVNKRPKVSSPKITPPRPKNRLLAGVKAEGKKRRYLRPRSKRKTLGSGKCSKCHSEQDEWLLDDQHAKSADRFFDQDPKVLKIAKFYGIKPGNLLKGNQLCMDCHGTVVSKRRKRDIQDGVSCESCHGPSKGYLKPHEKGKKALGEKRPGYIQGLKLGLVKLKDQNIRAKTCSSCHYITDKRLLSSGHSSGSDFDYAKRIKKVKHWEDPLPSSAQLKKFYASALAKRGPVPKVVRASLPGKRPGTEAKLLSPPFPNQPLEGSRDSLENRESPGDSKPSQAEDLRATLPPLRATPPPPPRPDFRESPPEDRRAVRPPRRKRIIPRTAIREKKNLELSPFPKINEAASIEDVLLILKNRLDELDHALHQAP